jgi:methylenetetrahydrofolate--tRNA-(uracil-5-)-methyltransferase
VFVRYGMMHRNTFINAPTLLEPTMRFRTRADLFFAGQITGVEGYIGNAATGLVAGLNAARWLSQQPMIVYPETTMLGALCRYITHADPKDFQPMKANFGILPPLENAPRGKRDRYRVLSQRAIDDMRKVLETQAFSRRHVDVRTKILD